jgi:hypothetical protein
MDFIADGLVPGEWPELPIEIRRDARVPRQKATSACDRGV